jgi:hypothetical protein
MARDYEEDCGLLDEALLEAKSLVKEFKEWFEDRFEKANPELVRVIKKLHQDIEDL